MNFNQDLNPIELVWDELKNFIRESKPQTKEQFLALIEYFWQHILTVEKCQKYVNHVVKVFPHVILNNGYATAFLINLLTNIILFYRHIVRIININT